MVQDQDYKLAIEIIRHREGMLEQIRKIVEEEWYQFIQIAPTRLLVELLPNVAMSTGQAESDPYKSLVNKMIAATTEQAEK